MHSLFSLRIWPGRYLVCRVRAAARSQPKGRPSPAMASDRCIHVTTGDLFTEASDMRIPLRGSPLHPRVEEQERRLRATEAPKTDPYLYSASSILNRRERQPRYGIFAAQRKWPAVFSRP